MGEFVQSLAPGARVVKAFNTVYYTVMAHPATAGGPVSVLISGDDAGAKARVAELAKGIGFEPVDVGQLLDELADDLDLPREALQVDEDVFALAHADLLRHAIENLVANARKYASSVGLGVSVRAVGQDTVVVEVRDEGPGLTPANAERAAER